MINQLLHSSENERRRKKIDSRVNISALSQHPHSMHYPPYNIHSKYPLQYALPLQLVNYTRQSRVLEDQSDIQDIQHSIRSKLRQKDVYLPNIYQRQPKLKSQSPHYRSIEPVRNKPMHFSVKKRLKSDYFQGDESEQQNRVYDNIFMQIRDMNDRFNKHNKRRGERQTQRFKQFGSRMGSEKQYYNQKNKFNHPSRQQEFQHYVNHLQKNYNSRAKDMDYQRDLEMQSKLKNKGQIKRNINSKAENPEMSEQKLPHSRLSQKSQEQMQQAYKNEQKAEKQRAEASRLQKKREINDNFVKLLRKVKNRGQSLLIKLNKFPSQKIDPK